MSETKQNKNSDKTRVTLDVTNDFLEQARRYQKLTGVSSVAEGFRRALLNDYDRELEKAENRSRRAKALGLDKT